MPVIGEMSHIKRIDTEPSGSAESIAYSKITWRVIPFLFACYVFNYLDRVNVGFAKLQMLSDLKLSETAYGIGAGIFFIGYFLCEVPSNMALHRVGARKWIARIMLSWSAVSASTMFVKTAMSFYALRFLLGIAEAGFFPGIILYLTYWYPASRRARITALFMTGIPIAGVVGGPLSGWILSRTNGVAGFPGWRWLFLLEAIPSLICGLLALAALTDRPAQAGWLTADEKAIIERALSKDRETIPVWKSTSALTNHRLWLLSGAYFGLIMGLYGIGFWLPSLIQASGINDIYVIGLVSMLPYAAAAAAMLATGYSSDRQRERRWHVVIPGILGAAGLILSTIYSRSPVLAVASLTAASMGIMSALSQFWSLPAALMTGAGAAAGIAAINSIGNLAGFISPYMVGWIQDKTHSTTLGLYCIAVFLAAGSSLCLTMPKRLVNR